MSLHTNGPYRRADHDPDACLRENLLALISDPGSQVVAFPSPKIPKARNAIVSQRELNLIPRPRGTGSAAHIRLVMTKRKSLTAALEMSLGRISAAR